MEQLGRSVAIEKTLQQNTTVKLYNNKIDFYSLESMLAHIGTVFSILESYRQRGDRRFEVKVVLVVTILKCDANLKITMSKLLV